MQLGLPFDTSEELPLEFYYVRHRRARRYVLRLDLDGRVRVTIPRGGSRREADAFAQRQAEWIRERVREHRQVRHAPPPGARPETPGLRASAKSVLVLRLMELAAQHGLTVARVSVRNQRSRWGSCGRDGHICLNWRLVLMPEWVRDYVLVHELMHLRRMDHSPAYWRLVAAAYPMYRAAREWLRCHGPELR
jgi:predicted metal-dependent hydrolase